MRRYILGIILASALSPSMVFAQTYGQSIESQKEQVQYILDLVQTLPSATNEQLSQKISMLQQALQLQTQVNALQYQESVQPALQTPPQVTYGTPKLISLSTSAGPVGTRINFIGTNVDVNDSIYLLRTGQVMQQPISAGVVDPGLGFTFPAVIADICPFGGTTVTCPQVTATGSYGIYLQKPAGQASNILYFLVTSNTTPVIQGSPSIVLSSNPQADLQGNVTIRQGDSITLTGIPANLVGAEGAGYSKAFFFDTIFAGSCAGTNPSNSWSLLCSAAKVGAGKFYIEVYQGGQTYRSNSINVTVTNRDGSYVDDSSATINVQTGGVDQGTPTSARLLGYTSRAGKLSDSIQAWFEWSTDPYLDGSYNLPIVKSTEKRSFNLLNGTIGTSAMLVNLRPSTTYYYRLVITSGTKGVERGNVRQFTTEPQHPQAYFY